MQDTQELSCRRFPFQEAKQKNVKVSRYMLYTQRSRTLDMIANREIGLWFVTFLENIPLRIGVILDVFHADGNSPKLRHLLKKVQRA